MFVIFKLFDDVFKHVYNKSFYRLNDTAVKKILILSKFKSSIIFDLKRENSRVVQHSVYVFKNRSGGRHIKYNYLKYNK